MNSIILIVLFSITYVQATHALPPPEDIPEEVLRTEIIVKGRSPVDGSNLNASEYAQLQEQLRTMPLAPELNPQIQNLIFDLQILKTIRDFTPF